MSVRAFGIMFTLWNRDARNTEVIEYVKEVIVSLHCFFFSHSQRLQELLMTSESVKYQDHKGTLRKNITKRKESHQQKLVRLTFFSLFSPLRSKLRIWLSLWRNLEGRQRRKMRQRHLNQVSWKLSTLTFHLFILSCHWSASWDESME